MRHRIFLGVPTIACGNEFAQRTARLGLEYLAVDYSTCCLQKRDAVLAGVVVQELYGRITEAAFRHVDDALESEIVGGLIDQPQIGKRVADFHSLVKARTAD